MPAKKDDDKPVTDAMIGRDDVLLDHGPKDAEQAEREKPRGNADNPNEPAYVAPEPEEPMPEPRRIEDLLKDRTFDREGRFRVHLAELLQQGVEFAPPDLLKGR